MAPRTGKDEQVATRIGARGLNAGWTTKIHGETLNLRDDAFTFTLRQPLGVVGAIVPWNVPF
jgi:aldehyde dehydrogenase (NAD+)